MKMTALVRRYLGTAHDNGESTGRTLCQSGEQDVASDRQNTNLTRISGNVLPTDLQSLTPVWEDNEVLAATAERSDTLHKKPDHRDAVFVDMKTVETKRYSLSSMSSRSFVEDRRFDVVSLSWAVSGCGLNTHGARSGLGDLGEALESMIEEIDPSHDLVCHGGGFIPLALKLRWSITYRSVFDTAAYLRFLGIEDSLENGAQYLGLSWHWVQGSRPGAPREAVMKAHADASARDMETTRKLFRTALADPLFSGLEFQMVKMTCRQNLEGIRIDRSLARDLHHLYKEHQSRAIQALVEEFDDFDLTKIGNHEKFKAYCLQRFQIDLKSTSRKDRGVIEAKRDNSDFRKFFDLSSAVKSWGRYADLARKLGRGPARVHGALRYYGGRTGRWSSGGLDTDGINFQGLPKGRRPGYEDLAKLRGVLIPEDGESWIASDLSAIEARVLLFLAGATDALDRIRSGEDLYCWFAMQVFPGKVVEKGGENGHLRPPAKEGVLSLGYAIGFYSFYTRLLALAEPPNEETAREIYDHYSETFPEVVQLREDFWSAFTRAFDEDRTTEIGGCTFMPHEGPSGRGVTVILPTDRPLFFRSIVTVGTIRGNQMHNTFWFAEGFTGDPHQSTSRPGRRSQKRCRDGRWRSEVTLPMLTENICQGIARDVLAGQMLEIEKVEDLRVAFHVHDEGIVASRECTCPDRDRIMNDRESLENLHNPECPWIGGRLMVEEIMSSVPDCFPKLAELPLACEVSERVRDRFSK